MEELTATQPVAATPRTWKPVYTIVERNERKWWTRVGTPNHAAGQNTMPRLSGSVGTPTISCEQEKNVVTLTAKLTA
jgi:hypothetical protein